MARAILWILVVMFFLDMMVNGPRENVSNAGFMISLGVLAICEAIEEHGKRN